MTKTLQELARQAGLDLHYEQRAGHASQIIAFGKIVQEQEREWAAAVCHQYGDECASEANPGDPEFDCAVCMTGATYECEQRIRAGREP